MHVIEQITTGQSNNQAWHEMRQGMMTALNFHRIRTRTKTLQKCPSKSAYALLRQLCGVNTSFSTLPLSLKWGHKNEKKSFKIF